MLTVRTYTHKNKPATFGYGNIATNNNQKAFDRGSYDTKQAAVKSMIGDAKAYNCTTYFDWHDEAADKYYRMIWNPEKKKFEKKRITKSGALIE